MAPEGCDCLKILPHIPYIDDNNPLTHEDYAQLKERVIDKLERMGLTDLRKHVVFEHFWTPLTSVSNTTLNKGSIYCVVSDRFKNLAFKAPKQSRYPNPVFCRWSKIRWWYAHGHSMRQNVAKKVVAWNHCSD